MFSSLLAFDRTWTSTNSLKTVFRFDSGKIVNWHSLKTTEIVRFVLRDVHPKRGFVAPYVVYYAVSAFISLLIGLFSVLIWASWLLPSFFCSPLWGLSSPSLSSQSPLRVSPLLSSVVCCCLVSYCCCLIYHCCCLVSYCCCLVSYFLVCWS